MPKDPNSRIITSIRSALHQIRECTRALRQMDIPWDTSNKKALEKFYHDFEAVRVKVWLMPARLNHHTRAYATERCPLHASAEDC